MKLYELEKQRMERWFFFVGKWFLFGLTAFAVFLLFYTVICALIVSLAIWRMVI